MIGIEIQEAHQAAAVALSGNAAGTRVQIIRASLFDVDLRAGLSWRETGPLLVLGNPPWVTSAALGKLGSSNLPGKWNIKNLKGLDAVTGSSNFDIAEAVWFKLLVELAELRPTIALLCKMSVARAVLEQARKWGVPVSDAAIYEIDAARWFGAAVGACLLRVTLGDQPADTLIPVYGGLDEPAPLRSMGYHEGKLVADFAAVNRCSFALGRCPLTWRQGVKHDAASVMELEWRQGPGVPGWHNKLGQDVDVDVDVRAANTSIRS